MLCKGDEEIPASSITDNQYEVLFVRKLNSTILMTLLTHWPKKNLDHVFARWAYSDTPVLDTLTE